MDSIDRWGLVTIGLLLLWFVALWAAVAYARAELSPRDAPLVVVGLLPGLALVIGALRVGAARSKE